MIERVTLIGVGLIGGSLAAAWKHNRPDLHLTGCDHQDVLDEAVRLNLIDDARGDPAEAVNAADLVVLATPVGTMPDLLDHIAPHLQPGTLITDVGSVKLPVVQHAERVLPDSNPFIGGHPMAGSERRGAGAADPFLFENATYVLCPPPGMEEAAFSETYSTFIDLIRSTGANLLVLDPDRHDRIAATVSHVPQLVAVALMNLAAEQNRDDPAFLRLAAGGFRDMTRIAASSFEVWDDILMANRGLISGALDMLQGRIQMYRTDLDNGGLTPFADEFRAARAARRAIPRDMKGFLYPLYDVYVYAQDRPGFLYHLTRHVYEAGLNIKDLELLKIREGTGGAFRMGFERARDANQAVELLTEHGYTAYRL